MFGRDVFLKGKRFHSIVVLVPFHVSKLSRVHKELIAYLGHSDGEIDMCVNNQGGKLSVGYLGARAHLAIFTGMSVLISFVV
jgi:hypothetical protein